MYIYITTAIPIAMAIAVAVAITMAVYLLYKQGTSTCGVATIADSAWVTTEAPRVR